MASVDGKTIYYFSGTGNSLAAAKCLAQKMGKTSLVNIAKVIADEEIVETAGTVGLVFPVYFEDMPGVVRSFVDKLRLGPKAYVFGVATCGSGGGMALFTLDKLLRKKGYKLSAGFTLTMPDNVVVVVNLIPRLDVQSIMLRESNDKIGNIAGVVKSNQVSVIEGSKNLRDKLESIIMRTLVARVFWNPKKFRADQGCTACGVCERICPTGNIKVQNERVIWGKNCSHCLACLHWCPANAIALGKSSPNARYHHPEITVNEMMVR